MEVEKLHRGTVSKQFNDTVRIATLRLLMFAQTLDCLRWLADYSQPRPGSACGR